MFIGKDFNFAPNLSSIFRFDRILWESEDNEDKKH